MVLTATVWPVEGEELAAGEPDELETPQAARDSAAVRAAAEMRSGRYMR